MIIWELIDDCGATLVYRATEKEIRNERRRAKARGMDDLETKRIEFTPTKVGIADLLNRYGRSGS